MSDVLDELFATEPVDWLCDDFSPIPMYVLTNACKLHGSACILYEDLLVLISQKINNDFYIIPSSIHEVLLIPAENATSYDELSSMVREINSTQVSREEILSDHVYFYSRHTHKITM